MIEGGKWLCRGLGEKGGRIERWNVWGKRWEGERGLLERRESRGMKEEKRKWKGWFEDGGGV